MIHRPLPNPDFDAGVPGSFPFSDCEGCGERWPCSGIKADTAPVVITGVGLGTDSNDPEIIRVELEIDGRWVPVIRQHHRPDDLLGATVEPLGIRLAARLTEADGLDSAGGRGAVMTMPDSELRRLAEAATMEAWDPWGHDSLGRPSSWTEEEDGWWRLDPRVTAEQARFVAAVDPQTILALLDRAIEAERRLAEVRAALVGLLDAEHGEPDPCGDPDCPVARAQAVLSERPDAP